MIILSASLTTVMSWMIELLAQELPPLVTTSQVTNSPRGISMHLRSTGSGNSSENQACIHDHKSGTHRCMYMYLRFISPITHNEILLPTLTGIIRPPLHSTILPLIAVLELTIATAEEFNWITPISSTVMSWNEKGPHGGAVGVGGLWLISVEQFTGELTIHWVVAERALSWLQVSEISSPTQATIAPLIWDGEDVRKFKEWIP